MAIMIPGKPLDYDSSSKEDIIFDVFKEKLPNNVYVVHSLKISDKSSDGKWYNAEIDFLIIIPNKGLIAVEAKAGQIYPEYKTGLIYEGKETNYLWHYANGDVMNYNGPFRQVDRAWRNLGKYLKEGRASIYGFGDKYYPSWCVCLPSIPKETIDAWNLPPDAGSKDLIISKNDLDGAKLYDKLLKIIDVCSNKAYIMDDDECRRFIQYVISPSVHLLPAKNFWVNLQEQRIASFIKTQIEVLDFLEEQNIAVIGGAAGTGKTVVALEKARRISEKKEKVLFLCYNRKLKDYLDKEYVNEYIRFETIDSLAYSYFGVYNDVDYSALSDRIFEDYSNGVFEYKNFIIDEAQDFGKDKIEKSGFLAILKDIAEETDGCCYFFYDKYQLVQSKEVPSVIQDADCKISLFKNCRNTKKIASTSYKVFYEKELSKREIKGFEEGMSFPKGIICEKKDTWSKIEELITYYKKLEYKDIVVLSAKGELTKDGMVNSSISDHSKGEYIYPNNIQTRFLTCRTFKGLEAHVVILIDVDKSVLLDDEKRLLFYVGASRAKFELAIIFNLSEDECTLVTEKYGRPSIGYSPGLLLDFELDKWN